MHASFADVRNNLAEIVNQVADDGQRVLVMRRGKPVVALVPVEDMKLLEQLEDEVDRRAVRKARKERGKAVPLAEFAAKHGIKLKSRVAPTKRRTA